MGWMYIAAKGNSSFGSLEPDPLDKLLRIGALIIGGMIIISVIVSLL